MTVCRPKPSTLFALSAFIILVSAICVFLAFPLLKGNDLPLWRLVLLVLLSIVPLALLFRMFWSYKRIEVRKDRIRVAYPLRPGGSWEGKYREVSGWKEERVQASGNEYREILVAFESGKKIKVSLQEYTNYQKLLKAFERHAGKKMK